MDASGKLLAAQGKMEVVPLLPDGAILTDHTTGERWRFKKDEWVPTWPRITRPTKSPQGKARYERRVRNWKGC